MLPSTPMCQVTSINHVSDFVVIVDDVGGSHRAEIVTRSTHQLALLLIIDSSHLGGGSRAWVAWELGGM